MISSFYFVSKKLYNIDFKNSFYPYIISIEYNSIIITEAISEYKKEMLKLLYGQ